MTLQKAIRILETHGTADENTTWAEYLEAVKLGIEALKRIIAGRPLPHPYVCSLLPHETNG